MTVLEQRFMERIPNLLHGIEEQLTRIADALEASNKQNNKEDKV